MSGRNDPAEDKDSDLRVYESTRSYANRFHPLAFLFAIWRHRYILGKLIANDLRRRYRGSILGYGWALIIPISLLVIFTTIFTVVFEVRWSVGAGKTENFAMLLFIGLICLNFITECMNRAPDLLLRNQPLIKRLPFPVEMLPVQLVAVALVNLLIGLALLLLAYVIFIGVPPVSWLLLPVVLLPLILLGLAVSWLFTAAGVFIRDLTQITPVLSLVLLFLSAIFYPLERLQEPLRTVIMLNPLAVIIDNARRITFYGEMPDWLWMSVYFVAAFVLASVCFNLFAAGRRLFADAL